MRMRWIAVLVWMTAGSCVRSQTASVSEQYLFRAANAERALRGLGALSWDVGLQRAAHEHAQQMSARRSISHRYAGEPELAERGRTAGARFSHISENVGAALTAVRVHDAWMKSPGHRENLLDAHVDAVGISVVQSDGQLYAVQDFARLTAALSFEEQEEAVSQALQAAGVPAVTRGAEYARKTCELSTGFAGPRQPAFVVRYTSADLALLPQVLKEKLTSVGGEVVVGACAGAGSRPFSVYSVAVMLFR